MHSKGAVFLCGILGLVLLSCTPSSSRNLQIDSEVLSLATNTEKLPENIEEKSSADTIALYYSNPDTKKTVINFFSDLTDSTPIAVAILDSATKHKVPTSLAFALAYEESRFDPKALNKNENTVDRGLFQLNSSTFPKMTEKEAFDPQFNAKEGMRYFRHVLDISGNEVSALAMYNAGRTRVSQKGAPVATLDYISRILNYEKNISSLFTAKVVAKASVLDRVKFGLLTQNQKQGAQPIPAGNKRD
ncbi:MAG: lytic transglycosylase domain-containing protein [Spirochaetaceae bacterium]|nr:lytic transglycosylase domain-containing protein [Spirochaetaceae bacterium]